MISAFRDDTINSLHCFNVELLFSWPSWLYCTPSSPFAWRDFLTVIVLAFLLTDNVIIIEIEHILSFLYQILPASIWVPPLNCFVVWKKLEKVSITENGKAGITQNNTTLEQHKKNSLGQVSCTPSQQQYNVPCRWNISSSVLSLLHHLSAHHALLLLPPCVLPIDLLPSFQYYRLRASPLIWYIYLSFVCNVCSNIN